MSQAGGRDAVARAESLAGLFADSSADFGVMSRVAAAAVPQPYRSLLDHRSHMTVAMERQHGGPVGLRVVAQAAEGGADYAREILLIGPGERVVQFGIVRLDLGAVDAATAARIRAGNAPLGRILLEAGVLCDVGEVALLEIVPGAHLRRLIGPRTTFGRVAAIAIDGRPAIELLEIVAAE